jgi:flagellar protein FliO/FliZ
MKKIPLLIGAFSLLPAAAQASEGPELAGSVAQMVGSLVLVIGIILIIYYLAGRFLKLPKGGGTPFRYIRVVETRHLAPKKSLVLVEVAGEYLLLSNTGEGVSFIKQVDMVEDIEVVDERGYATLIPAGLLSKLKKMASPSGTAELCLHKKSGGFA